MVIHGFFYTFSSTHNYHSYVKSQASQASRWSPWLPIRGFPQIGGYPQKKHSFLDWEFPINNRTLLGSPFFSLLKHRFGGDSAAGLDCCCYLANKSLVDAQRMVVWVPNFLWIEWDWNRWLFQDFFGSRQVGELWINSPRFMGKWDRNQPEWGMNPQWGRFLIGFTSLWPWLQPPLYSMFFFLMGHTANTANKIYSLRSFAGWFTLW